MPINNLLPEFELPEFEPKPQPKILRLIQCFDCKQNTELDGYRFALVPLCSCCRTNREVEITGKRFERRHRKR